MRPRQAAMLIEGVGTDSESAWRREGQFFRRQIDRDYPLWNM